LLQASLIFALGAQNIFVLESGLKKQRNLVVAAVCTLCDAFLIAVGVAGAASIFVRVPSLKIGFGLLGVGFLFYYGVKKIFEGLSSKETDQAYAATVSSLKQVILLSLSFSLLNPHVYLDTVVLIGGYSAKFPELSVRAIFGLGASSFSLLWFFGLSIFASFLSHLLNNRKTMKIIALVSGLILLGLSWKLGTDVFKWMT
jgi:L-lysine exporter family protein LysE/ArgO